MVFNIFTSILAFAAIIISGISLLEKRKQGSEGPQGPKGDKGDKGDTGPRGPRGPKGDNLIINTIDPKDIPFIVVDLENESFSVYGTLKSYKYEDILREGINPPPSEVVKIEKNE